MKFKTLILLSLFFILGCSDDNKTLIVDNFDNTYEVEVIPYRYRSYTMMNIWVKGYTNDTILVRLNSRDSKPILKLSGKIDKRWYTDYYGSGARKVFLDPYKANKGVLELKVKL